MPSPFPGMNPYLEQEAVWHDFHERFCPAAAEALTIQIRPHFIAKIDQRGRVEPAASSGRGSPDALGAGLPTPHMMRPQASPSQR